VVINPGHIEPGAGSFRADMSATMPPGDATPTERINKLRQTPAQRVLSQPAVSPRPRDQQSARSQRTRRTVDLPASTHRALDIWQREAADRLGVARVTGQEVLIALVDQLLVDPKLSAQVTRAIESKR
jgi:hypothetical protein